MLREISQLRIFTLFLTKALKSASNYLQVKNIVGNRAVFIVSAYAIKKHMNGYLELRLEFTNQLSQIISYLFV